MTAAAAPRRKMTLEEWAALPEDEPGELVDGELVDEEMPSFVHEVVVAWLIACLRAWARPRGGFVAASGVKRRVSSRRAHHRVGPGGHPGDRRTAERRDIAKKK